GFSQSRRVIANDFDWVGRGMEELRSQSDRPPGDPGERPRAPRGKSWLALAVLLVLACGSLPWGPPSGDMSPVPRVAARRAELAVTLRAAGQVESSVQTLIRCELENIKGYRGRKAGATTILSLVPEGTRVRAGDVLCRLDASEYEELARLQRIVVAQARA